MRVNTSRSRRLAFGRTASLYDVGRPTFSRPFVDALLRNTGVSPPATVLEIGAGTGQLTRALLETGVSVIALEPDARLASLLEAVAPASGALSIQEQDFEIYAEQRDLPPIDLIVAANSFHWLDPATSYAQSARLVGPGGPVFLTWNFPILRDAALQRQLNESVLTDALSDLRRDPSEHLASVEEKCAEGREELRASGVLRPIRWSFELELLHWSADRLATFYSTYASVIGLEKEIRDRLGKQLPDRATIEIQNILYYVIAESYSGT